nr:Carboxylesterase domain containing protein [Haemonchus contortus]
MGTGVSTECSPLVKTSSGPVRGRQYLLHDGRAVDMYMGIPYAEPPVGNLRYKKPQPVKPWTEVLCCTHFGPRSPQTDEYFAQFLNVVGQDEARCLTLNVFAPRWALESEQKLAVMVWIHGGGFSIHSSSNYGDTAIARNLCVKNVVVVSMNYRLGPLGFFTTGDDVCRGNMGLWDQALALRWVHDNIEAFGGDRGNVTVFGQSAGGASADLLAISPHTRDLFHRVIPMAGCGECDFAMRTSKAQSTLGREYARYLGWTGRDDDSEGLMHFMEAQPAHRVAMGIHPKKGFHPSISGNLLFVPNFDGDFFPKPLEELRRESPRKSIMTGTTQHEGLFFVALGGFSKTKEGFRRFCRSVIKECDYADGAEEVRQEVYEYYMKDVDSKDKARITERLVELMGDYAINVGVLQYARKMSEYGNNVYFYCFDYFNPDGFGFLRFILPYKGSTHCSEVRYVLGKGVFSKFKPNHDDLKMLDIMTTYFTNFAKYGDPCGDRSSSTEESEWELYSPAQPYHEGVITRALLPWSWS